MSLDFHINDVETNVLINTGCGDFNLEEFEEMEKGIHLVPFVVRKDIEQNAYKDKKVYAIAYQESKINDLIDIAIRLIREFVDKAWKENELKYGVIDPRNMEFSFVLKSLIAAEPWTKETYDKVDLNAGQYTFMDALSTNRMWVSLKVWVRGVDITKISMRFYDRTIEEGYLVCEIKQELEK